MLIVPVGDSSSGPPGVSHRRWAGLTKKKKRLVLRVHKRHQIRRERKAEDEFSTDTLMFTARCVKVDEVKEEEEEEGDADLIRSGSQGVCAIGTLQMLVLLCGNTRQMPPTH